MPDDGTGGTRDDAGAAAVGDVDDAAVVQAAVDAAEDVIFSGYSRSEVRDLDVTVHFADGVLEVDVYLDVPDDDAEQVADDAALAARAAVDDLLES